MNLPLPEVEEIEIPRNQWAERIMKEADKNPVSSIFWNEKPKTVVKSYDWGEIEFTR